MKCKSCDAELADGVKYCPSCGCKAPSTGGGLSAEDTAGIVRRVLEEFGLEAKKPKKSKKPKKGEESEEGGDDDDDTFHA